MAAFKLIELTPLMPPADANAGAWRIDAEAGVDVLRALASRDEIPVYGQGPSFIFHGFLASTAKLTADVLREAQPAAGPGPEDTWAIQRVIGGQAGYRMYLEAPFAESAFRGGEQIVIRRHFRGYEGYEARMEVSQKLAHSLEIYPVEARNALCRLDAHGDLEDVIRFHGEADVRAGERVEAVSMLREDLDRYMALAGMSLVYRFDFTRVVETGFAGFHGQRTYDRPVPDGHYHGGEHPQGSYCNGVLVVPPRVSRRQLIARWKKEDRPKKQRYEKFLVENLRDGQLVTVSCSEEATSNYFEK